MDNEQALRRKLAPQHRGVLATLKHDGMPQLSTISYTYDDGVVRISSPGNTAKARNLKRDSRVVLHVDGGDSGGYVVAECTGEVSAQAARPDDAVVDELVEIYRSIAGEHPDWDEFRAAMVAEQRTVLRLTVDRLYGWAPE